MQLNEDDAYLLNWAEHAFDPKKPQKIGLAVSGGSDSLAMLRLLASVAKARRYDLSVATVDHGLRPAAVEEAQFVATICETLGLAHQTLKWTGWTGKGNVQAKARDARYQLLADWAKASSLQAVAIGHTADDQAETFLARLARGSGLDGLAGMDVTFRRYDMQFIRPCLMLERDMLRCYLQRHGHEWRDDPSNEDEQYQRIRARKILDTLASLGIDKGRIVSTASQLKVAKTTLQKLTLKTAKSIISFKDGDIVMPGKDFATLDHEIGRRVLGMSLMWLGQTVYPPRAQAVSDLQISVLKRETSTLNGCHIVAMKDDIRISREFQKVENTVCATDHIWDTRWQLDGPHASDLEIRVLGPKGLPQCPDWRAVGLPRTSLLSSPSIWRGDELIAAPLAKLNPEWTATLLRGEKQFFSSIVPH